MTASDLCLPTNQLLASLPLDVYGDLLPWMDEVALTAGVTLYEAGTVLRYVYFPVTAVVSLNTRASSATPSGGVAQSGGPKGGCAPNAQSVTPPP